MNKLFISSGPDGLLEAADALLSSDTYDMAVVQQAIDRDDPLLVHLDDGSRKNDRSNTDHLRQALPQLDSVGLLIKSMWDVDGYKGTSVDPDFMLDDWRKPSILPHIDSLRPYGVFEAGLQLSMCLRGARKFAAERLDFEPKGKSRELDLKKYNKLMYKLIDQVSNEGRSPRTYAELAPGDIALFPHHPVVTLHSVEVLESDTIARLITYYAKEV